jgi:hypothetical protein
MIRERVAMNIGVMNGNLHVLVHPAQRIESLRMGFNVGHHPIRVSHQLAHDFRITHRFQ